MTVESPLHLIGTYLSPSIGVGQSRRIETIDERLRRLPLDQSLLILSEMCFRVEQAIGDVDALIELTQRIFPAAVAKRATEELHRRNGVVPVAPQVLVLLGIRLLAVSDGTAPDRVDDELARELGGLCLSLTDRLEAEPLNPESMTLEILRLGLFSSKNDFSDWLTLTCRLFFETLPEMTEHPDWNSPAATFEATTGLTLERFWAITVLQGILAGESPEDFQFPVTFPDYPLTTEECEKWMHMLSRPVDNAKELAKIDAQQLNGWAMSTVWKRPVIDLGSGRGPVLRPRLLQMQAEPAQMFWHLGDALETGKNEHLKWSRLYGGVVEHLGIKLLRENLPTESVLAEKDLVAKWRIPQQNAKRADAAVIGHESLVVIDFVARQFTLKTTTDGDFGELIRDLRKGVTEKLLQVDSTLAYAIKSGFTGRIYPMVVTAGPLPSNHLLAFAIAAELDALELQVIGVARNCMPWIAVDLVNFSLLVRYAKARQEDLAHIIDEWQNSAFNRSTFRDWHVSVHGDFPDRARSSEWTKYLNRYSGGPPLT